MKLSLVKGHFDAEILRAFGDFREREFEFCPAQEEQTNAIGKYLVATMVNKNFHRQISFAFLPSPTLAPAMGPEISISIDNCAEDSFGVCEFLRTKGVFEPELKVLSLRNYSGDLPLKMRACLSAIHVYIEKYMMPILLGKTWQHVPIDWGDMK